MKTEITFTAHVIGTTTIRDFDNTLESQCFAELGSTFASKTIKDFPIGHLLILGDDIIRPGQRLKITIERSHEEIQSNANPKNDRKAVWS